MGEKRPEEIASFQAWSPVPGSGVQNDIHLDTNGHDILNSPVRHLQLRSLCRLVDMKCLVDAQSGSPDRIPTVGFRTQFGNEAAMLSCAHRYGEPAGPACECGGAQRFSQFLPTVMKTRTRELCGSRRDATIVIVDPPTSHGTIHSDRT